MPSAVVIPHSEPWRIRKLALLATWETAYATQYHGKSLSVARYTMPQTIECDEAPRRVFKPYFTGCIYQHDFIVDMDEDTLSALRSTCAFVGVDLEECILTELSLGGGVDSIQLIIAQNATAVQGLIARSNVLSNEEERMDTPVSLPSSPATSPGQEICVMSLIGITEALTRNVGEDNQRINGIVLDFTRQIEAHTTSMLANKVSMLDAFCDRLTNFGLKVDTEKMFDDLDMSQYATLLPRSINSGNSRNGPSSSKRHLNTNLAL